MDVAKAIVEVAWTTNPGAAPTWVGLASGDYFSSVLADSPYGVWRLGEASGTTAYDAASNAGNGTYQHGTYSQTILADSPTSYWRLGEPSGTSAADSAGSNTGTYVGSPTLGATGLIASDSNTAATFNGTTQRVDGPVINMNGAAVTVEAWINPVAGFNSTSPFISQVAGIETNIQVANLRLGNGTSGTKARPVFNVQVGGAAKQAISTSDLVAGTTYHLVGVYDGSNVILYVNGVSVATTAATGSVAANSNFYIGWDGFHAGRYTNGTIDEVAVYPSALSASTVLTHYNAGHSGISNATLGVAGALTGDTDTAATFAAASFQDVALPNTGAFAAGNCTYECWFKTSTTGVGGVILSESNSAATTKGTYLAFSSGNKAQAIAINDAGTTYTVTGTTNVCDGNWHHLALTKSGTTLTLYVDGASEGTPATISGVFTQNAATIAALKSNGAFVSYTTGTIDEPAIYKSALSSARILAHYNAKAGTLSNPLRALHIKRGRQFELDRFEAGTATLTLDNRNRNFDPTYTSSAYYPNVLPMRRVRVRAIYSSIPYTIFDGYIDGWPQSYDQPNEARVDVPATDGFKVLALSRMPTSVYDYEVRTDTPLHWWRLNELQGTTANDSGSSAVAGVIHGDVEYAAQGCSPFDADTSIRFRGTDVDLSGQFQATVTGGIGAAPWSIEYWSFFSTEEFVNGLALAPFAQNATMGAFAVGNDWNFSSNIQKSGTAGQLKVTFFIYNNNGTGPVSINSGFVTALASPGWHHCVATLSGTTLTLYVDGTSRATGSYTGGPPPAHNSIFAGGGTNNNGTQGVEIDEIAIYNTALSATRVLKHYNAAVQAWSGETADTRIGRALDQAGWSTADRALDVGAATLGSAKLDNSVKEHIEEAVLAEDGNFFVSASGVATFKNRTAYTGAPGNTSVATFGDSGSELKYADVVISYDDQHIINEVKVTRTGGTTQISSDATSQTSYLKRTYERSDVHCNSDADALTVAGRILARYKNPVTRIESMTVKARRDPANLYPQVLGLDLLGCITVNRRPQGGTVISQKCLIEGIEHTVTPHDWTTTYQLSPTHLT